MYLILVLFGLCLVMIGLFYFAKLGMKLILAVFYWIKLSLSSEKTVDEVYMKKVMSHTKEYQDHVKQTDNVIEDLLKD